jgi:hypothetical protein
MLLLGEVALESGAGRILALEHKSISRLAFEHNSCDTSIWANRKPNCLSHKIIRE